MVHLRSASAFGLVVAAMLLVLDAATASAQAPVRACVNPSSGEVKILLTGAT
jgi:hypothetical protein